MSVSGEPPDRLAEPSIVASVPEPPTRLQGASKMGEGTRDGVLELIVSVRSGARNGLVDGVYDDSAVRTGWYV